MVVFTNCSQAELFVNGRSLGKRTGSRYGYLCWKAVSYETGKLIAVGDGGTARDERVTCGAAKEIKLWLEHGENDIIIVNAAIVDEYGNTVPNEDCELSFCADLATDKDNFAKKYVRVSCNSDNSMSAELIISDFEKPLNAGLDLKAFSEVRLLGTSSGWAADHMTPHSGRRRSFKGLAQAIFKLC